MKPSLSSVLIFALITAGILVNPAQAAPSGAIFTTTANGSRVNANLYSSKCEVYLDGGPGVGAPASAAGLPDGQYYFQVTDPSGKHLLSSDVVSNRRFQVANGVIVAYTGLGGPVHPIGYDQDHPELAAITIRVANATCPADFLDSPNGGGVYKVWVTPVADFAGNPDNIDLDCGNACYHGFLPSKSKTDNFKAKVGTDTFCLTVWKRILDLDHGAETPGSQWRISVMDPLMVNNVYYTGDDGFLQICGMSTGTYTVTEDLRAGYSVAGLTVNGETQATQPVYAFFWSPGKPEPVIIFKNSVSRRAD
jgi:hypothetical protein